MENKNPLNELEAKIQEHHLIVSEITNNTVYAAQKRFEDAGGCMSCRGRGWVVTWDTMDSMTGCYHESGPCENDNCTRETRAKSGLLPRNTKYDNFHHGSKWVPQYTDEENKAISHANRKISDLRYKAREARDDWETLKKGKLVKIEKKGRGRNSKAVGTIGILQSVFYNSWGTQKLCLIDKEGNKHWTTGKSVVIVDPSPSSEWSDILSKPADDSIPFIGVVKHLPGSGKSALIRFTNGKEAWIPFSQCPSAKGSKKGDTITIYVPKWLAEKNGLTNK